MSRHPQLYHWEKTLARHFPKLPATFVVLLALWTLGMILARRCGLSSVALFLARTLGRQENTMRQRLREFYQEKTAKAGAKHGRKRRDFAASGLSISTLSVTSRTRRDASIPVSASTEDTSATRLPLCTCVGDTLTAT